MRSRKPCVGSLLFLISLIERVLSKNKAILINCSFQYENYRHFSNVLALQTILLKNGYPKENISVFIKENILKNTRNPFKHLCIGNDMVHRREIAETPQRSSSYFDILNMIAGEDPVMEGADQDTNLLIYITGHGGDGFIKHCNREYLYTADITSALIRLQAVRRLKSVLFISDTCQSDTLVDVSALPDNVFFVSTSLKGESSHSSEFNCDLNIFPIDLFVMHLYTLDRKGVVAKYNDFSLFVKDHMPPSLLYSTVTVHRPFCISDFLYHRKGNSSLYL